MDGRSPLPAQNPPHTYETDWGRSPGSLRDRYLLFCVNLGRSQTVVRTIHVGVGDKDEDVFNKLRQVYYETRGWWGVINPILTLADIRYVKV